MGSREIDLEVLPLRSGVVMSIVAVSKDSYGRHAIMTGKAEFAGTIGIIRP